MAAVKADQGKCPNCGKPRMKLRFTYNPELVTATSLDPRTSISTKTVTFIRCSDPMGYAHESERYENVP